MDTRKRKPDWLKIRINQSDGFRDVIRTLEKGNLTTVCSEANCPNQHECWGKHKTATFMVLGEKCTRNCRFCSVNTGKPLPPDPNEPVEVAKVVKALGLKHAVITMVTRDDLADGGAVHLAKTVKEIRTQNPDCRIEVLSSDFQGDEESLKILCETQPDVLSHNLETVRSLKKKLCPATSYDRSLEVLKKMGQYSSGTIIKSSLMIGVGEIREEILETMDDLLNTGVQVLNIGQYLRPDKNCLEVEKYWHPDEFELLKQEALAKGFLYCESAPLVRSSYHAGDQFELFQ